MTEQHMQMASKPCKIHWCQPRFKSHEYNLRSIKGKCLEGVGIPDGGRAVINRTIQPRKAVRGDEQIY